MSVEAFSESVQRYLKSGGYSQKKLADEIGLHPKVLSRKLHGTENAYLTHQEVRRIILVLADWHAISTRDEVLKLLELAGIEPAFLSESDWQQPPLNRLTRARAVPETWNSLSSPSITHNLPAPTTRLIGREWAVGRLQRLLERDDVRLLTLVGTGGSGKTRLALHIAREQIPTFPQGVWFVPLVGVSDPEQVPMSIIQALHMTPSPDISPFQSLLRYLRKKRQLLVLDNFEHLEAATPVVAEMLARVPNLKILVTSRAVLHTYGEYEFSVPPLDVPAPNFSIDLASLQKYGAVQLFIERAQAVQPDFALSAGNASTIAQICGQVDGLPLALELAAARIKVLPPDLLLERLSRARLPVLTGGPRNLPPKLQTLRNTITWSYNLLSPVARVHFRRLSIFTGSWSLEAAETLMREIGHGESDADSVQEPLDLLEELMNQSLLTRQTTGDRRVRFAMLATLREYAREQLAEQGELELLRDWHASYYLRKVEIAEDKLRGPEQLDWLARLVADSENIRAALEWSLQRARENASITIFQAQTSADSTVSEQARKHLPALEVCLRMASALSPYWEWKGYLTEGRYWLLTALAMSRSSEESGELGLPTRAKALSQAARLVFLQNDASRAVELADASIALWRRLHDPRGLGWALLHRGWAAHGLNEYETEKRLYREGLSQLSPETDAWLYAQLLMILAAACGFTSEFDLTRAYYAQSREIFERLGDKSSVADLLKDQGGLLILEGSYSEAIDHLLQSIRICRDMDHRQYITTGIEWLSYAVGLQKTPDPATAAINSAQLRGFADALMNEIGMKHWSRTFQFIQVVQQHIRSFVDEKRWDAAVIQGRSLTLDQAIDLVVKSRSDQA